MTAAVERALRDLAARRRRVAAVRAILLGTTAVGAWLLGAMLLDRWLKTPASVRQVTTAVAAVLAAGTFVRVGRLLLKRRVDFGRAAATAESLDPAWDERLSTLATQAALPADRRGSAGLLLAMGNVVERELRERPPAGRVTFADVRPAGMALAVVLALWLATLAIPWVDAPRLLARQMRPKAGLPPVTSLSIEVQPHAKSVRQGQSLSITADVEGGDAAAVLWWGPDASQVTSMPMTRAYGGRFMTTLQGLQSDFLYHITADDATSPWTAVRVIRRPGVSRLDITLTPPGGPPETVSESDGRLRVVAGTRVAVAMRVTEPVRSATVVYADKPVAATADADGRTWRAEFVADVEAAWSIELTGRRSQHGAGPAGMRIELAGQK